MKHLLKSQYFALKTDRRVSSILQLPQYKTEALITGTDAMGVNLSAKLWALTSSSCQQVRPLGFVFDSPLGFHLRLRHKLRMRFIIERRLPECNFVSFSANSDPHAWFYCLKNPSAIKQENPCLVSFVNEWMCSVSAKKEESSFFIKQQRTTKSIHSRNDLKKSWRQRDISPPLFTALTL